MSTAASAMQYVPTPVRPSKRKDLMVISEMRTSKIVSFLAYRHRVGLLASTTTLLVAYLAYDKFFHMFF